LSRSLNLTSAGSRVVDSLPSLTIFDVFLRVKSVLHWGPGMGRDRFRKRQNKKKNQSEFEAHYTPEKPFAAVPVTLAQAGKFVSAAARVVCLAIVSSIHMRPSYKELQQWTGFGSERTANALDELLRKKIIECDSGKEARVHNIYRLRPIADWELTNPVLSPSEKRKRAQEKKSAAAPPEAKAPPTAGSRWDTIEADLKRREAEREAAKQAHA
jgi:hypothetical protein